MKQTLHSPEKAVTLFSYNLT